ncbi:MAG: fatty acid desaturase [Ferruginibacter sp.]
MFVAFCAYAGLAGFIVKWLLGFNLASIGFCTMHDANHGSFSSKQKLNDFLGLSLNALGGSSYFWKQKHNIIHHTYTNVDGMDDDIAKSPIIRQCESQKWVPAHKIQYLYMLPIYSCQLFSDFYHGFYKIFFTQNLYNRCLEDDC